MDLFSALKTIKDKVKKQISKEFLAAAKKGEFLISQTYLEVMATIPECKLVAIADVCARTAQTAAEQFDCGAHAHYHELLDGNNIAYANGTPPEARLIKQARAGAIKLDYEPIVIISAALRYKIDDKGDLLRMINLGWVIESEGNTDDDIMVIETAISRSCKIVSNDRYLQYDRSQYRSNSWNLSNSLVKFNLVNGKIVLNF